jgi:dTDP-4-amino-4,6-dideoxygalactose transaminase
VVRASQRVPFLDLGAATAELRSELDTAIGDVLDSGWYLLGSALETFEGSFASWTGAASCVGVANGLDALTLSLRAMEVGPGDEVIVPSNTYIATWLAVDAVGATIVPVEPDASTYNITAAGIADAISPRTRAVLPVHLYGQPAAMSAIVALAHSRGVRVIDDAAQAHGARWNGTPVGTLADITAWSFYPGKNLGALGDGGAITTNDATLAERVRLLRNYGSKQKYLNEARGVNSRLDDLQAAILSVKLRHLDAWNRRRAAIAARYSTAFLGLPLVLPELMPGAESAWHLYVVRSLHRDALQRALDDAGVHTLIHYPIPPHRQRAFDGFGFAADAYPVADEIASTALSLPIGPQMSSDDVDHVIAAVRSVVAQLG